MKKRKEKILKLSKQVNDVKVVNKKDSLIKINEFVSKFGLSDHSLDGQKVLRHVNDDYKMPENGLDASVFMKDDDVKIVMMGNTLQQELKNKKFELLLRGSMHGLTGKVFNERCYDKGSILVIVQCKENEQRIFGGYTKVGFKKGINDYQKDDDAFVYCIEAGVYTLKTQRFHIKRPRCAIYSNDIEYYGVSFGNCDLYFNDDGTGGCKPCIYEYSGAKIKMPLHGEDEEEFTIKDYEVWKVI